ncbi:hypothetical protein M8C21_026544 [Ambrosia artemisiifolia]|uniref:F-box domain-containing protein n=1 Tax=Ambrosia artemisiifolia TaxID=4212 RepID=A0AAD5C2R4_AMBAR|nr:hypothetical protein M8C21_026544 [Ambrosia artemisiifolia]
METIEHKQADDDDSKISYPEEIIEQIISRLPIKSILRFKSISKPWLSLISNPSFTKLHSTVGPSTTSLFLTLVDSSTNTRYFFSGANNDNGSVANLIKLDNTPYVFGTVEHLNGLLCLIDRDYHSDNIYASVINPTTHKFFKLPDRPLVPLLNEDMCYFFGFDESSNEHKVLYVDVGLIKLTTIEIMIFSFLNYSWRKINVDLPIGVSRDRWFYGTKVSVCVNSIIHMMIRNPFEILAFDLRTETFSIVNVPPNPMVQNIYTFVCPYHRFLKINGLLGIAVIGNYLEEIDKVDIWILQDYENRVWVRETVTFPPNSQLCYGVGSPYPFDSINMDEIIFYPRVLSENLISVPIYNMKTRCFKSIQLTLGHRFLCPESVEVEEIKLC